MSSAWTRRLACASFLLATACRGSADGPASSVDASADAAPKIGIAFSFAPPSLACAGGGLCTPPAQLVTLGLVTTADTSLQIALEGNYADGALTADHVTTVGGHASVTLETPSTPTTFTVVARAAASSASATLTVAVGADGFATVNASATYVGQRPDPGFLAVAVAKATCFDFGSNPPNVSTWLPAPPDAPLIIAVPANEIVAIYARIGHYATGCNQVGPLAASATSDVSINVFDVPMALELTDMSATFTFIPSTDPTWQAAMAIAAANVGNGFFGSASDGPALLDEMRTQVPPSEQADFDSNRDAGAWNASASSWLTTHAPTIHDRASTWLSDATGDGVGPLVMHLGVGPSVGTATVTPTSLGPLAAPLAGLSAPTPFNWTAAADDTVHLAGPVVLSSYPYVAHLADTHAAASVTNPTSDVPGAIASEIDCQGLASSLLGTTNAYGTCGASCFGYVCVNALEAAWNGALGSPANGSDGVTITLTVGDPASVGDEAEPHDFQGGWLGQLTGTTIGDAGVTGTVIGQEHSSSTP